MSTLDAVVASNNYFTAELAKKISSDENIVMSPLSMLTALALVCLGVKGKTEAQMKKVLHFESCTDIHSGFKQLLSALTETEEYILNIDNTLFVEETFNISETFINVSKVWYNSNPELVDFKNHPRGSWEYIVNWLKGKTEDTFQNMSLDSITNNTKIVVVNTAYLLANWTQSFHQLHTQNESFTLSTNEIVYTQLMSVEGYFNIREITDEMLSIIELPYGKSKNLRMYVILPGTYDGLKKIQQNISYEQLNDWTNPENMNRTFTEVYLPHFKIDSSYSMKDFLHHMGMTDVFIDTRSNLTEISQESLYVSDIINLVTMEADEDGTKESTDIDDHLGFLSLKLPQMTFKADHPFIFIIRDMLSKCFIFYGAFQKP
ncbi:ovalbumin-related protein Y-like [Bufo bufo]|uniref:ovalbumin-related protein Y-like n=1 Tax=Bufo bufo TaxID=8384 RepID=UPI001ABE3773|nr:ovalbumin-related protein Y-like [Bufo bufo]